MKEKVINPMDTEDFRVIKFTGVLSEHIYKKTSEEDLNAFIHRDVLSKVSRFVSEDWLASVTVEVEYLIIDTFYNPVKSIRRTFQYSHREGLTED